MKYQLELNNTKGNNKPGEHVVDSDPGEHGHIVYREESDILAKALSGYIQDIDSKFWLLRVDVENPVGTVLLTAGGDHRIYMLDSEDFPDGAIFPITTIPEWKKHNLNVAVLMSEVGAEWGWTFSVYKNKFDALTVDKLLEKMFNGSIKPSKIEVFEYLHAIEKAMTLLRQDNVPISILGHCTSTSLVTKYIALSGDYNFNAVILMSPIFMPFFENELAPYERYFKKTTIPTLIINHKNDPCNHISHTLSKQLSNNHVLLEGGTDAGCPNFSLGHHGFRGIEDILVKTIANFIA